MTPGGWIMGRPGAVVWLRGVPAGVGNTEQQIAAMHDLKPVAYTGTPSFLRILLEKADELGTPITSLKKASVSGEYFPPAIARHAESARHRRHQTYGRDLGLIAYEAPDANGNVQGMVIDGTSSSRSSPRHWRTGRRWRSRRDRGDHLQRRLPADPFRHWRPLRCSPAPAPAAAPYPHQRAGWAAPIGPPRSRGMFVHPSQVDQVAKRFPELGRVRLAITNPDQK